MGSINYGDLLQSNSKITAIWIGISEYFYKEYHYEAFLGAVFASIIGVFLYILIETILFSLAELICQRLKKKVPRFLRKRNRPAFIPPYLFFHNDNFEDLGEQSLNSSSDSSVILE